MKNIPECLSRRYKAADEFIKELSQNRVGASSDSTSLADNPEMKLMCQFWNILEDHPDVNLKEAVKARLDVKTESSCLCLPQRFACYMASDSKRDDEKRTQLLNKQKRAYSSSSENIEPKTSTPKTTHNISNDHNNILPLHKVLCNLKQAASLDKKCHIKVNELRETQKELRNQIKHLEEREIKGVELLKQMDSIWTCMENSYKQKIAEALERQQALLNELKETEASNLKWRKNKTELEFEMNQIDKCQKEIEEKIVQKTSDLKYINVEIENFKKRIERNKKDIEASKTTMTNKKKNSDTKMANIATSISKLENTLKEEKKLKINKEIEGNKYIKEARDDLQNLSKLLLQKKFEKENLAAERNYVLRDIETLKETANQCKDVCKNKEQLIDDEILELTKQITEFRPKCTQCHESTDTIDVRKLCTDCPRCVEERNCLFGSDHCCHNTTMDCVCMFVKQKFLDNVFDNMYTVLERHTKTGPGKSVANVVLKCLKRSRNGKLDNATRNILQDFILTTVRKNLNLTIIGGAVKTRCEMDQDTYDLLMLCLKQVKETRPPTTDKGTAVKKDPCARWGDTSECNCPKGPKDCPCSKKTLQILTAPAPCYRQPKEDETIDVIACPQKGSMPCVSDCATHAAMIADSVEVSSWRPKTCEGPSCQLKNMRAAQCVLGPEVLSSVSNSKAFGSIYTRDKSGILADQITCKCGSCFTIPCSCRKDLLSNQLKVDVRSYHNKETSALIYDIIDSSGKHQNVGETVEKKSMEESKESYKTLENRSIKPGDNTKLAISLEKYIRSLDSHPIISQTPSGNLKIAVNSKLFNSIKKHSSPSLFLSGTNTDQLLISQEMILNSKKDKLDLCNKTNTDPTNDKPNKNFSFKNIDLTKKNKEKIKAKFGNENNKTISGHLFETKSENFAINVLDKSNNKEDSSQLNNFIPEKQEKSNAERIYDKQKYNCFTDKNRDTLWPLTFKGFQCPYIDSFIVLKITDTGDYEVVLNKEFENIIKRDIRHSHIDDTEESCIEVERSDSGRFVIDVNSTEPGNAVIIRNSLDDSIKLNVFNSNSQSADIFYCNPTRKESIVSKRKLKEILSRHLSRDRITNKQDEPFFYKTKYSNSDSKFERKPKYTKVSNESCKMLKRTASGNYTINFKNRYGSISNNKSTISSELDFPAIKVVPFKKRCKSLKITPCGSIYILIDDNLHSEVIDLLPPDLQYDSNNLTNEFSELKITANQAISTTCNAQPDNISCDVSKCACRNINYNSKDWNIDDSSQEFHDHLHADRNCNNSQNKSETYFDNRCVVQELCSYGFKKSSNPNMFSITSFRKNKIHMPPKISRNEMDSLNFCSTCNFSTNGTTTYPDKFVMDKENKEMCSDKLWDNLELLPPQLPSFLKDRIYI